jgi:RNA polymerase sigma-70 factor (ECF subfamily)
MDTRTRIEIFTREYLAYRPILERTVLRILRCGPQEIEDVLQDVWINGATYLAKHPVEHHKSWLYMIAVRASLNRLRHAKSHPESSDTDDDGQPFDWPDQGPRPDELADWRNLREAMMELERRIPKQIAALRLVHLEEYTYLEAARMLGIAEGTAKSNAHKALKRLRTALLGEQAA